ncbi:hypothetical protein [Sneathiella sp.]|uniref:hypothetical protein n=1 Tax=Sneathiella sp. TaxID=1964365 RepID=UPI0025DE80CE|nr:hypothetical protein [Sneathiella sp.]
MGKSRLWTVVLLLAFAISTGGCSSDMFKSADQKVAGAFGETCSFTHLSKGKEFCPEVEGEAVVQAPLYCYRSLGTVDCYSEPNPYLNERSPRVRKVPPLASMGAPYVSASEYQRLKAEEIDWKTED